MDAKLLQRAVILGVDVVVEDQIGIGRAVQPAIVLDLVFQLTRAPAGIAERKDRLARTDAVRDRFQDIECRRQRDAVVDRERRVLDEEIARMKHEAALLLRSEERRVGKEGRVRWAPYR